VVADRHPGLRPLGRDPRGSSPRDVPRFESCKVPLGPEEPAITNDEAALLAAVCSRPDDDAPRLVYADWLDEHGRPARAALIRAEVEGVRELAAGRRLSATLVRRLREARAGCPRPLAGLPKLPGVEWAGPTDRGFPARIRVADAAAFLRVAGRAYAAAPVSDLSLGRSTPAAVRRLAASPHLARLRRLDVSRLGAGDAGVEALAGSPHLRRLEHFTAPYAGLSDRAGVAVAVALAGRLRHLCLDGNPVTDVVADAIAAASGSRPVYACPPRSRLAAPHETFPGLVLFAQETRMTGAALRRLRRPAGA
jgi:uncharacterized protein (TIGR02996 family)